jgi:putative methyltransferase (TIGR04325 family)
MKKLAKHLFRRAIDAFHRGGTYRGVYHSFAEAIRATPKLKPFGYDHAELAKWYRQKLTRIGDDDYPALFWIGQALKDSRTVFDIGGHVGVACYGFSNYLNFPPDFKWQVCDVPAIAAEGQRLAAENNRTDLSFVSSHTETTGADILFSAGALQYIETPSLAQVLAEFTHKPQHIVLNNIPIWDKPAFVTMQSIGFSYCPYLIRNRAEFIASIEAQGYQLRDTWTKPRKLHVRFRRNYRLQHYTGFYFVRNDA